MLITDKVRKFYKEAMQMEDYYRNSMLIIGLLNLLHDGYLTGEDIAGLPDDLKESLKIFKFRFYSSIIFGQAFVRFLHVET